MDTAAQPESEPITTGHLAQMADLYHVPVSHGTLNALADEHGQVDPAKAKSFQEYLNTTAQGLYPTLAPQIAAGIPTGHLVSPYTEVAKMVLGDHVEPNYIADPKWGRALTGAQEPKTGRPAPMGLDEWRQTLMNDRQYGYEFTPQAQEHAAHTIAALNEAFS